MGEGGEGDVEVVLVLGKGEEAVHHVHEVEDQQVEVRAEEVVRHVEGELRHPSPQAAVSHWPCLHTCRGRGHHGCCDCTCAMPSSPEVEAMEKTVKMDFQPERML